MPNTKQTDGEIHGDQLPNFLVNRLNEEVFLNFANSVKIDAGNIYEVLADACTDGTSVPTSCESSEDAPPANTVFYHLRTKFELDQLQRTGNTPLQRNVLGVPLKQMEVCVDPHPRLYCGDEDDIDGLCHPQIRHGTTASYTYVTPYVYVKNKRHILTVRRLEDGDTAGSVLAGFLDILDGLDLNVKAAYLDRELYDSKCLMLLQVHNHAYVTPVVCWGQSVKQRLSEGWSRVIQRNLTVRPDGHSWTVEFPVYIGYTYQNGRYDEHGVVHHGYTADMSFIDSPRDVRYHYTEYSGIEASYRLSE